MNRLATIGSPWTYTRSRLAKDATMRLPRRLGATIVRVESGTVLVTREGDVEDHVLGPGDELVLPRRGVAVAWAFTDAAMSTREAVATDRPAPATRSTERGTTS